MNNTELIDLWSGEINSRQGYYRVVKELVPMHPLRVAFLVPLLFDRLSPLQKVCMHNELEASIRKHFVVEKHAVGVREFASVKAAQLWADGNAGARLVEGEK